MCKRCGLSYEKPTEQLECSWCENMLNVCPDMKRALKKKLMSYRLCDLCMVWVDRNRRPRGDSSPRDMGSSDSPWQENAIRCMEDPEARD